MNNTSNSSGFYADLSLPQFVRKLTADSITTSRMSVGNDNYGATTSSHPSSSTSMDISASSTLDSTNVSLPGFIDNFSGDRARLMSRSLSVNDAYSGNMMPQVMTASSTSGINVKTEPGYELANEEPGIQQIVKVKGK